MQPGMAARMKTAISVDDTLMEQADAAARELGLSRSALISTALREFLRDRRSQQVTERLNRAYAEDPMPEERRVLRNLRAKLRVADRW